LSQVKFYWDLAKAREDKPIALVRVEQPYPFPAEELKKLLGQWKDAEVVWAQEEPENMGSWSFIERELRKLGLEPKAVTREESASPATGSLTLHKAEHEAMLKALDTSTYRQTPVSGIGVTDRVSAPDLRLPGTPFPPRSSPASPCRAQKQREQVRDPGVQPWPTRVFRGPPEG
jgi:hypothetical protein